jgi:hypothetical protein
MYEEHSDDITIVTGILVPIIIVFILLAIFIFYQKYVGSCVISVIDVDEETVVELEADDVEERDVVSVTFLKIGVLLLLNT